MKHYRSRSTFILGIAITVLGAIFAAFALAPLLPGGVPTFPLEHGGVSFFDIPELLLGAIIIIIGFSLWKFGYRHKVIFSTAAVIAVFFLSVIAFASSINLYLYFTEINVNIQYGTNDQGDFGPTEQTFPIAANQNLTVGDESSFIISFTLHESSTASGSDGIASIKAAIPAASGWHITSFKITSVSPSISVTFSPGSSLTLKLSLVAATLGTPEGQNCLQQYCPYGAGEGYYGPIDLVITTTNG